VPHKEGNVLLLGKSIVECYIGSHKEHVHKMCWICAECQIVNLATRMRLIATRTQRATVLWDAKI